MRDVETLDGDVADFKAFPCSKQPAIKPLAELVFEGFLGGPIAVNGNVKPGAELNQPMNMISVFVRNENAGKVFRRAPDGSEALTNLAQAEPGINQDAGFVGFQISAIAGRTAAENSQTHCHAALQHSLVKRVKEKVAKEGMIKSG